MMDDRLLIVRLLRASVLLLTVTSVVKAAEWDPVPPPTRSVVYKRIGDVELKLFIFEPPAMKAGASCPAIVFFFGGGWKNGTPGQFYHQCAYFAARGMVAMSAEYRIESKHHTTPKECVMDAVSCVRWIRANAADLKIDPTRIAAGGGSAGGHVAAATAMLKGFDTPGEDTAVFARPDALVLFNPVLDNGPGGYGYDRVKDYYQSISPYHNVAPGLPPTLLMLGTKDQFIPTKTLESFKANSEKLGNRCDLILYPDQKHGFFNFSTAGNPLYDKAIADVDAFLVSLGYLPAKPLP